MADAWRQALDKVREGYQKLSGWVKGLSAWPFVFVLGIGAILLKVLGMFLGFYAHPLLSKVGATISRAFVEKGGSPIKSLSLWVKGLFVSTGSYHKHSMYLISNSELFGLTHRDVLLAALVARYHRRASPKSTHQGYTTLDRDSRIAVVKMAALLRVAIALDDSHSQRIKEIRCSRENGRLVISVPNVDDLSVEQLALHQSRSLFEETFGLQVLLRGVRP